MTAQEARHLPARAARRIITPPMGTGLRDTITAALIVQGVIRLIDGRLFTVQHLDYGSNELYGALMLMTGLWLLVTRWHRSAWYGALAAAFASAFYVWLALAVWESSATSGGAALVFAVAMFAEARAMVWRGGWCGWKLATSS